MSSASPQGFKEHRFSFMTLMSLVIGSLTLYTASVHAADWSDTSLGWRYGTMFAEPYVNKPDGGRQDIGKNIVSLTHSSGYQYGTNFFNADLLLSDSKDPGKGTSGGAQEAYVVYRNMVDFGKIFKKDLSLGPMRSFGAEAC